MTMSEFERKVLAALDGHGALLTRDVAANVRPMFGHSVYIHSAAVRQWLLSLEKRGLVRRLDNEKPVCWQLVERLHS
ncbi:hypothetical protein LMG3410_01570 [Achromobacter aegrifaciens]|uniref:Uncharacterized protein n=2 Tax=Alcaligenaceae TaxID=506 RepID=A0ABM8LKV0_9BURK|nr:hypothetical protein [Achromobacter aegrifaciens]AVG44144.1 hypothetical protein MC81_32210 [Achromobacter insolitus]CAB3847019.1 hypothetical protein LMG3410_01570 [Achromobacter aegrifaciens]CAB3913046.1 hypothetical protein LMG3415_05078 [Achromobacter mucicolens]